MRLPLVRRRRPGPPDPAETWRGVAPLRTVIPPQPPLVAAPRSTLPRVAGTTALLPPQAPHRPQPAAGSRAPSAAAAHPATESARPDAVAPPADRPARAEPARAEPAREQPVWEQPVREQPLRDESAEPPPALSPESPADDEYAGPPLPEAPVDEPRPVDASGLEGLIALLDSEVQRSRILGGEAPAGLDAGEPERPTLYRPTLAQSRRRGVGVGAAAEPAPESSGGPPTDTPEGPTGALAEPPAAAAIGEADAAPATAEPDAAPATAGPDEASATAEPDEASATAGRDPAPAMVAPDQETARVEQDQEAASALRGVDPEPSAPDEDPGTGASAGTGTPSGSAAAGPVTRWPVPRETHGSVTAGESGRPASTSGTESSTRVPARSGPSPVAGPILSAEASDEPSSAAPERSPGVPRDEPTTAADPTVADRREERPPEPVPAEELPTRPYDDSAGAPSYASPVDASTDQEPGDVREPLPDDDRPPYPLAPGQQQSANAPAAAPRSLPEGGVDASRGADFGAPASGTAAPAPALEQSSPDDGPAAPSASGDDRMRAPAVAPEGAEEAPAVEVAIPEPVADRDDQAAAVPEPATPDTPDTQGTGDRELEPPQRAVPAGRDHTAAPATRESEPTRGEDEAPRLSAPDPHPVPTAVPRATVASFERMTGIDLGFVPVNRAPRVATTAAEAGARAYTAGGVVHLPSDAGPLERPDNEALLVHELAHVAQQRASGPADTGQEDDEERERQADTIERAFRGESVTPEEWEAAVAELASAESFSWNADDGFVSAAAPQAAPRLQRKPQAVAEPMAELGDAFAAPFASDTLTADSAVQPLAYAEQAATPEQTEAGPSLVPEPPAGLQVGLDPEALEEIALQVSQLISVPRLDIHDPILIENLALNLYDHVRTLLRHELLVDRERTGVLTEFHQE